jgi:glycogen(starch) synthase
MGGYEIRCAQVAEALQRAGHDVCVLTSVYGLPLSVFGNIRPCSEESRGVRVHRWLNQYYYEPQPRRRPWTLSQAKRELYDARQLVDLIRNFRPDIVNWWSMYALSKLLLPIPRLHGIPDIHWIEHWWMIEEYGPAGEKISAFWKTVWDGDWGPRATRFFLRWLGRHWERQIAHEGLPTRGFPNKPTHVCFVSQYLESLYRDAGFKFVSSEVIHGGVPSGKFHAAVRHQSKSQPLRILYAGQISADRGLHTVIEALGQIAPDLQSRVTLSVVGGGQPGYLNQVKERVEKLGLTEKVIFLGMIPHEQMPDLYKRHDILVFPSIRQEGLPLTMVEAMMAGCAVLTTGSGGAMEIAALADLPLFPKNDPLELSRLLTRLIANRVEVAGIASRGQEVALREFSFDRMMERFSATLIRINKEKVERGAFVQNRKNEARFSRADG